MNIKELKDDFETLLAWRKERDYDDDITPCEEHYILVEKAYHRYQCSKCFQHFPPRTLKNELIRSYGLEEGSKKHEELKRLKQEVSRGNLSNKHENEIHWAKGPKGTVTRVFYEWGS